LLPQTLWQASVSSNNLVISPNFEDSTVARTFVGGAGATGGYSTAVARSGTQCYAIQTSTIVSGGESDIVYLSAHTLGGEYPAFLPASGLKVQPGQWYYGEFYVRANAANTTTGGGVYFNVSLKDSTGVNILINRQFAGVLMSGLSSSAWTKVGGWLQIPAGYDLMFPGAWCTGQNVATQTFYFDDVRLVENTQAQSIAQAIYGSGTVGSTILPLAVPTLDASKIATGTLGLTRIPTLTSTYFPMWGISQASGANLVHDTGFENAAAWSWLTTNFASTLAISTAQAHGGTHSMKCTGPVAFYMTSNDVGAGTIRVNGGEIYQLGTWVYLPSTNANTGAVYLDLNLSSSTGTPAAANIFAFTPCSSIPANTWTYVTAKLTVPAGYDTCNPLIWTPTFPATDVMYVDDLLVREVTLAQSTISALFSGGTVGSSILQSVVPDISAAMSSGVQALIDNAYRSMFGAATAERTQVSQAFASGFSGPFEVGDQFTFNIGGQITNLWFYRAAGSTTTSRTINLWDVVTQKKLASATTSSESGSGWKSVAIPPVTVAAGQQLIVSHPMPSADAGVYNNAAITSSTTDITWNTGCYITTLGSYPATAAATHGYGNDVSFVPTANHTLNDLTTALTSIPGGNIISQILASIVPGLDASKITSGNFAQSMVSGLTALWNGWFGTTAPTGATQLLPATVPALDASKVTTGAFGSGLIPSLDASKITTGTFAQSFISGLTTLWNGWFGTTTPTATSQLLTGTIPALPAGQITSGTFGSGLIPALDASKITSGTFAQTMVSGLTSLWNSWFGTTTPSGASVLNAANIAALPASQITSGTFGATLIPSLDASKITTGTFAQSFISGLTTLWNGWFGTTTPTATSQLLTGTIPSLPAGQITSGTFGTGLIPSLDASKITTGTFAQSFISGLTSLWNSWFGTTAPTGSETLLTTAVPALAASKITSGTFGTGLIPALPASQITSGTFGTGLIPALDASKITTGTFAQSFVSGLTALWNSWFGTTTPTGASVLNAANVAALPASQITSGTFGSSLIPSLDASKITTGTFAQSFISGLTSLWNGWFGTTTPTGATQLLTGTIPSLPAGQITSGTFGTGLIPGLDASKITSGQLGASMVAPILSGSSLGADLQALVTNITNYLGALSGTGTQTQAQVVLQQTNQQLANLTTQVQALQNTQTGQSNSGISITENFLSGATLTPFNTFYPLGSAATTGQFVIQPVNGTYSAAVWVPSSPGYASGVELLVMPTATTTDYQIVTGYFRQGPTQSGFFTGQNILGVRLNSATAPTQGLFLMIDYLGNGQLYYLSGTTFTTIGSSFSTGSLNGAGTFSLVAGTSGANNIYQVLAGNTVVSTYTDSSAHVPIGSSNRFGCFGGTQNNNSSTAAMPGQLYSWSIADNAPAPVVGSGFRQYRTSTATATLSAGLNSFPAGWFGVRQYCTPDLLPQTNGDYVQVTKAGWYLVCINQLEAAVVSIHTARPAVYHGTTLANLFSASTAQQGPSMYVGSTATEAYLFGGSIPVYCNAGDYLAPGYYGSTAIGSALTGEATGMQTYWSVAAMNFSLN